MRVLHTSDWHVGRTLYGRKRYEGFEAFLTWLAETIQQTGDPERTLQFASGLI